MRFQFGDKEMIPSFLGYPQGFTSRSLISPLKDAFLLADNHRLRTEIGLGEEFLHSVTKILSKEDFPCPESMVSTLYHGHQFGVYAGQLGDGRACFLGEIETAKGNLELQLKGAGRTIFSRGGDGRAVLRSSVREFLIAEYLHSLSISTTRSLGIWGSFEPVYRDYQREMGAVVLRTAPSFLRVGSFEAFFMTKQPQKIVALADMALAKMNKAVNVHDPLSSFFDEVCQRTARLVAKWQVYGFCHGVLNSDNLSVLGLTLDYGPYAIQEKFDPGFICNLSDYYGRYSWQNQPSACFFNLQVLANCFSSLISEEKLKESLGNFWDIFETEFLIQTKKRLGVLADKDTDELAKSFYVIAREAKLDLNGFYLWLEQGIYTKESFSPLGDFSLVQSWLFEYQKYLLKSKENSVKNPVFILRNSWIQELIDSLESGVCGRKELEEFLGYCQNPFDSQKIPEKYRVLAVSEPCSLCSCSS